MASKEKAKGNRFERECVEIAQDFGFNAKRAWGSDGRSIGLHPEVDVVIEYLLNPEDSEQMTAQCKVRKKIASYLLPPEECDIALLKQDRGDVYACIRYKDLLQLIQRAFSHNE
tara:strand:+ start:12679 stop:13020 length:342 start_codon:yes stop_codon:yes gene_type:complete